MGDSDHKDGRKTTAYILIGIAGYLILVNTGVLDFFGIREIVRFIFRTLFSLIPAAFVVIGAIWLGKTSQGDRPILAWFLVIFGAVMMISQFGLFGLNFGDMFLPLWLVFIALVLINPRNVLPRAFNTQPNEVTEDTSNIKLIAFMGGGELNFSSQSLTGGEIGAIWGGFKIDFTEADIADDVIEIFLYCIMGGVEIIVPPHWQIENHAICIMGGFSNKSICLAEKLDLPRKKIIIKGVALMGGGEIRN